LSELESSLYQSIEEADYDSALDLQAKIKNSTNVDDYGAVLYTNSNFYKAFSSRNYNDMKLLWLADPTVSCIHPSTPPIVGANDVLSSFQSLFSSSKSSNNNKGDETAPNFERNTILPTNIRLVIKGTVAILTCEEEIYTKRFVRGQKRKKELVNTFMSTNVYRKVGEKWYMVHHHASDVMEVSKRKDFDIHDFNMDQLLGIPSNDLGLGNKGKIAGGEDGAAQPVKRVFMGSLSDLLNGGLSDILSDGASSSSLADDDDDDDDDSASLLRSLGALGGSSSGKKPTIITLKSNIDADDNEVIEVDDDDDDDYDDDEVEEAIIKEEQTTEALKVIKDMGKVNTDADAAAAKNNNGSTKKVIVNKGKLVVGGTTTTSGGVAGGTVPKDALRQNCITALRKLCNEGTISQKQKRILLTDIITCSAKGEFSMVEVAFELLCSEGDDIDAAEEEFADQCRVFAMSLPEFPGTASRF